MTNAADEQAFLDWWYGPGEHAKPPDHSRRTYYHDGFMAGWAAGNAADPLAAEELAAMDATVALVHAFIEIVGDGPSRAGDINEFCADIHHIQSRILAQAAARAYPDRYRLLGGSVEAPT